SSRGPRMRRPSPRLAVAVAVLSLLAVPLLPRLARAATDLLARMAISRPATWDTVIVPCTTSGSQPTASLTTAPLLGSTQAVWFNWGVHANPAVNGHWVDELLLDGEPIQVLPRWNGAFVAKDWFALDAGPAYLRGGRHTLSAITDVQNQ